MEVQKTARLFATLAVFASLSLTAAQAATPTGAKQSTPTKAAIAAPAVTVKIGDALLEEYRGGNPTDRMEIIRGGTAAQAGKSGVQGKGHA